MSMFFKNNTRSKGLLDLKNHRPQKFKKDYGFVLEEVDKFSKFAWTSAIKVRNVQTTKGSIKKIPDNSIR